MKKYRASSDAQDAGRPLAALIGRPNVGKSSLFNRMVGGRPALVEDMPGVTRDRRYGVVEWMNARFRVVDTGGLDPSADGILGAMRAQTLKAVSEADVLVFVVDAIEGLTAVDSEVASLLRRANKPVVLAANKVDSGKHEAGMAEFYGLGFDDVFPLSAGHGRGVGDLLDRVVALLGPGTEFVPEAEPEVEGQGQAQEDIEGDDDASAAAGQPSDADAEEDGVPEEAPAPDPVAAHGPIRIAFIGKANAGKSSLVNRLLGEERVLVHDVPGTTRDPIDTPFSMGGQDFVLVDTAGLRRRRTVETLTDAVAAKMTRDQLARADVAVLVIDAGVGPTTEDAKIAGLIEDAGRAAVIILNKRDLVPRRETDARLQVAKETFPFLSWAPILWSSALTSAGVGEIPRAAVRAFEQTARRIPTGELNRFVETVVAEHPPPSGATGKHARLYFATQVSSKPPTFVFSTNHPDVIPPSYRRYLSNQLRAAYGFEGTPIRIVLRPHRTKGGPPPPRKSFER
ncbi:MAG TPA: ribosome biogenesis GTPase Der [Polyangia bacterium]|jgi:GTP-binding protein|nr:ribosome biogenesis GTPase Der [Polyangia bacterium]